MVRGVEVNKRTQCAHFHSDCDLVAIKFKCCGEFYACIFCHDELAGHAPMVWSKNERNAEVVLCGNCQQTLTIANYLDCDSACPCCGVAFNPRCAEHYHFYFEEKR